MKKIRHVVSDFQTSGALAEVRREKENLNILMGSEHVVFIGKMRDVQMGLDLVDLCFELKWKKSVSWVVFFPLDKIVPHTLSFDFVVTAFLSA